MAMAIRQVSPHSQPIGASKMIQRLPFVIAGNRVVSDSNSTQTLELRTGESVELPILSKEMVNQVLSQDHSILRDVPLQEIVAFLNNVGKSWKSEESSRRRLHIRNLVTYLGYSQQMAEHEANWMAMLLCSHYRIFDALDVELGSWHCVDRWLPRQETEVRAFPRGRSLHVLPGNVPFATATSVVRALVTKNSCVLKVSSEDPITPLSLVLSFLDVDPRHPVAKAMSVLYWPGGTDSPEIRRLVNGCDVVCSWGGMEAMKWVSKVASPSSEILKFGPRRSFAVIGRGVDIVETARRLAHDVCAYDQRACFSVQRAFVDSSIVKDLVNELERALDLYQDLLPKGQHEFDEQATWSLARLEALYDGAEVRDGLNQTWSIVVGDPSVDAHPLGRVLYVQPFESLDEIAAHIDDSIQTLAVAPWSLGTQLRDIAGAAGATRIIDLGLANVFRMGSSHDGMYPLQRLVRLVSHEASGDVHIKGITLRVDQTRFLEERRFDEFIP
jgi:long-chain-fatty-acyl-CoA reductase